MNCDQAFDYLTDSQLRQSGKLKRHLARCPRCRDMQQTLEPALDLFDSLATEPAGDDLVRDAATPVAAETVRIAQQTAARLGESHRRGASRWLSALRLTAAGLLGAAIVLGIGSAQDRLGPSDVVGKTACTLSTANVQSDRLTVVSNENCLACHVPTHTN